MFSLFWIGLGILYVLGFIFSMFYMALENMNGGLNPPDNWGPVSSWIWRSTKGISKSKDFIFLGIIFLWPVFLPIYALHL